MFLPKSPTQTKDGAAPSLKLGMKPLRPASPTTGHTVRVLTGFWEDLWIENEGLMDKFRRYII
jgi:hypothetical protein